MNFCQYRTQSGFVEWRRSALLCLATMKKQRKCNHFSRYHKTLEQKPRRVITCVTQLRKQPNKQTFQMLACLCSSLPISMMLQVFRYNAALCNLWSVKVESPRVNVHGELGFCAQTCTVMSGTHIRATDQTFPESLKKTDYLLGLLKKRKVECGRDKVTRVRLCKQLCPSVWIGATWAAVNSKTQHDTMTRCVADNWSQTRSSRAEPLIV